MIAQATLLAVVVLLGSVNLAAAQAYVNGGVPGPNTTLGWNFGHIAYCQTYNDGSTTWHFAFFQEGGYGYTNNPGFAASIAAACVSGNLIAGYVYSLNPLQWDRMILYPFQ